MQPDSRPLAEEPLADGDGTMQIPTTGTNDTVDPPYDIAAEQAVLGGLLLVGPEADEAWEEVNGLLTTTDFYKPGHRLLYAAALHMDATGQPLDPVVLAQVLESKGELEQIGGIPYLQTLAANTPSAANILSYAQLVRDCALRRALLRTGQQITARAKEPRGAAGMELLEEAESALFALSDSAGGRQGPEPARVVTDEMLNRLEALFERGGQLSGLGTGFAWLNRITNGLQEEDLVILAARPSTGKTALAMNIVRQVIRESAEQPVLVFSLEMSGSALMTRLIADWANISASLLRAGRWQQEQWERISQAAGQIQKTQLFINPSSTLRISDVRRHMRRLERRTGKLALVVIDYLQLMEGPKDGRLLNRTLELAGITRSLKALAKEFHCPMLVLSQLSRGLEFAERRPELSDLRDSGAIEQDADVVIILHRDKAKESGEAPGQRKIEMIVAKQRNGPTGHCMLQFDGRHMRFAEVVEEEDDEAAARYAKAFDSGAGDL